MYPEKNIMQSKGMKVTWIYSKINSIIVNMLLYK